MRKMAVIGSAYIIGLFIAPFFFYGFNILLGFLLAGLGILLMALLRKTKSFAPGLFILTFGIALSVYGFYDKYIYYPVTELGGSEITLTARVVEKEQRYSDSTSYVMAAKANGKPLKFILYTDELTADYESLVSGSFKFSVLENNQYFNQKDYYKTIGVYLKGTPAQITEIKSKKNVIYYIKTYSDYLKEEIIKHLPNEQGALIISLLTGDKRYLSDELYSALKLNGIIHIVSISGFHLSVAAYLVIFITRRFNKRLSVPLLILICLSYCAFTGFAISCVRACIMLVIFYLAQFASRRADTLNSLGLSAFLLTAFSPYSGRDTSLLLSLLGTFGVAIAGPSLNAWLDEKLKTDRLPALRKSFVIALCATACTAPISVMAFGGISVTAPFVTVLTIPFFSAAISLSIIYTISGGFLTFLLKLTAILLSPVISMLKFLANTDFVYYRITSNVVFLWLTLTAISIALIGVVYKSWKHILSMLAVAVLVLLAFVDIDAYKYSDKYLITLLSDSSGGAAVVEKANNADIIFLDSGIKNSSNVYDYVEASGIKQIDTLIFNEFTSSDIASFLNYEDFNIKKVILPDYAISEVEKYNLFCNSEIISLTDININRRDCYCIAVREGYAEISSENFSMLLAKARNSMNFSDKNYTIAAYAGETSKVIPTNAKYIMLLSKRQQFDDKVTYIYMKPTQSLVIDKQGNISKRRVSYAFY